MILDDLVPWLIHFKYLVIFPIAVIEGPIITIITGFLISLSYLNFWVAFVVVFLADLLGDMLWYSLGRFGRDPIFRRYGRFVGITSERLKRVENHFYSNPIRTFLLAKFAHGLGSIVWVSAGVSKVSYKKILFINFFSTVLKSLILILIGYYFGRAYVKLNVYLNLLGLALIIILIVGYFITQRKRAHKILD